MVSNPLRVDYTNPIDLSGFSEGRHYIFYQSKDVFDTWEQVRTREFYIDASAPVSEVSSVILNGKFIDITITGFDPILQDGSDGSGIKDYKIKYSNDGVNWKNFSTSAYGCT